MKVNNISYKTVEMKAKIVFLIDQNKLPFEFSILQSKNYKETCLAIKNMTVRGAGAIGVTAAFALTQAILEKRKNLMEFVIKAKNEIEATRPTAQNLFFATNRVFNAFMKNNIPEDALAESNKIAKEDEDFCKKISYFGNKLIKKNYRILTHCNAGWLAFVDYGSALSPIYLANKENKNIFVYVDETRPRSQGARLTAWELKNENVKHKIIPDNASSYLMANKKVDMIIVGADRIAKNGDVANKIGTLGKAISAKYYNVPFYVAAPSSTIDMNIENGNQIKIEERSQDEVLYQKGLNKDGKIEKILVCSPNSSAINPAFDITKAELITGIITEKGLFKTEEIKNFFDSKA